LPTFSPSVLNNEHHPKVNFKLLGLRFDSNSTTKFKHQNNSFNFGGKSSTSKYIHVTHICCWRYLQYFIHCIIKHKWCDLSAILFLNFKI